MGVCSTNEGQKADEMRCARRARRGISSAGEHKKVWIRYLLDDLRAFRIHHKKWMIAAREEGDRRDGEKREKMFKKWIVAECPKLMGKNKGRVAQS